MVVLELPASIATGRALHVERLLHHNRVIASEQMPIIGNIAKAIYRIVGVPGRMEHGQRAI